MADIERCLLRVTYKVSHPLVRKGKAYVQVPPLHLHFTQTETFKILRGNLGVSLGYDRVDHILGPEDEAFDIIPMVPHFPYPVVRDGDDEDIVVLLWAHPGEVDNPMDDLFFEHLFRYLSRCHESGTMPSLLQVMLMQHKTDSALVMCPGWTGAGSLRWWIPWKLQGGIAWIAEALGYKPLLKEYMKDE